MNTEANPMSVEVTVSPMVDRIADLRVVVVLKNLGEAVLQLNTLSLRSPTTALKMKGPDQNTLRPGPPPTPPIDDGQVGRVKLEPNQSITFRYSGYDYAAGRAFPAGNYQVMFRYENRHGQHGDWLGTIESTWVSFQIRSL